MAVQAPDDVVLNDAEARSNSRPPLVVLEPLREFLEGFGFDAARIKATAIGEGHSCATFRLELGGMRLVLRRPPRPPVAPSTHDVLREALVLRALADTDVPVPSIVAVCEDEDVIGAPFYLMEEVDGIAITDAVPAALDNAPGRLALTEQLVETLAALHRVDWTASGLGALGRTDGYLERQLRRFSELWRRNRTRDLHGLDRVEAWLREDVPESPATTVVHGDFRLGNALFDHSAPARLNALLDWEMSTLGDPLADLGYLVGTWYEASDGPAQFDLSPVTRTVGFPSRMELISLYEAASTLTPRRIEWYATLALWKAAIFMEGNYRRVLEGKSDDPYVRLHGRDLVHEITARANQIGPEEAVLI